MKPEFALNLSPEGITLLHRLSRGWEVVGDTSLEQPGLKRRLAKLRDEALAMAPAGITSKLILPESQVLYTSIACPARDDDARRAAVRQALQGMTPYAVDELRFDWESEGDVLHVAVVARETLEEAEAFAVEHDFNPVSVVAKPKGGSFTGEPFFGETEVARDLLPAGASVKRDVLPTIATLKLTKPVVAKAESEDAPDPEPPQEAVEQVEEPDVLESAMPGLQEAPPESFDVPLANPAPEVLHTAADMTEAVEGDTVEPAASEQTEPEEEKDAAAESGADTSVAEIAELETDTPILNEALATENDGPELTVTEDGDTGKADGSPTEEEEEPTLEDDVPPDLPGRPTFSARWRAEASSPEDRPTSEEEPTEAAAAPTGENEGQTADFPEAETLAEDPTPDDGATTDPEPEREFTAQSDVSPEPTDQNTDVPADLAPEEAPLDFGDTEPPDSGSEEVKGLPNDSTETGNPEESAQSEATHASEPAQDSKEEHNAQASNPSESDDALTDAPEDHGEQEVEAEEPEPQTAPPPLPEATEAEDTKAPLPAAAFSAAPRLGGAVDRVGVTSGELPPIAPVATSLGAAPASSAGSTRLRPATPPPSKLGKVLAKQKKASEEKERTVFGARKPARERSPLTGFVLTAGLVAFLAAVALWSMLFGPGSEETTPRVAMAPVEEATPPELPEVVPGEEVALAPDGVDPDPVIQPAPATAPPATLTLPEPTVDPQPSAETPEAVAANEPSEPELPQPEPEAATSDQSEAQEQQPPIGAAPEEDLAVTYAATGIWTAAPEPPEAASEGRLTAPIVGAVDPRVPETEAGPLPSLDLALADTPFAVQPSPLPAGTVVTLDERGLVAPSPEGAPTPEGTIVYAGQPPLVPPVRPGTPTPEAAEPAATETPQIAPRPRPEDLAPDVAEADAAETGPASPRPRPRPATLAQPQTTAEPGEEAAAEDQEDGASLLATTPSETVVASDPALAGFTPRARPVSIANDAAADAVSRAAADAAAAAVAEAVANPEAAFRNASDLAVTSAPAPRSRPEDLDVRVAAAAATTAVPGNAQSGTENAAAAAPPPAASSGPQIPTRASVASQATVENAIRLNRINLIGIYGSASDRRALVRLPSGRYVKVQVGDRLNGGQVAAISDQELRLVKGGRNIVLKIGESG